MFTSTISKSAEGIDARRDDEIEVRLMVNFSSLEVAGSVDVIDFYFIALIDPILQMDRVENLLSHHKSTWVVRGDDGVRDCKVFRD